MDLVQNQDSLELRLHAVGRTELVLGVSRYDQVLMLLEPSRGHGYPHTGEGSLVAFDLDEAFLLVPGRLALPCLDFLDGERLSAMCMLHHALQRVQLVEQQRAQRLCRVHGLYLILLPGVLQTGSNEELLGPRAQSVESFYLSAVDGESTFAVFGPVCGEPLLGPSAALRGADRLAPCREIPFVLLIVRIGSVLIQCRRRLPRLNLPFHRPSPPNLQTSIAPGVRASRAAPSDPDRFGDDGKPRPGRPSRSGSLREKVRERLRAAAGRRRPGPERQSCGIGRMT